MAQRSKLPKRIHVKDLTPVIIIWEDASVDPDFDGTPENLPSCLVENHTIGFLLRKNKKEVVLVRDINPADNTIRWPYGIPRKGIKAIVPLEPNYLNDGSQVVPLKGDTPV